jgi:DNA (cytosine-5)-methyltransferase 1
MRHLSFFTGIGVFDLAAKTIGWTNVAAVEKDRRTAWFYLQNHPETPIYGDIHTFPAADFRGAVDIVSGGDPCQPHSTAGKRLGQADPRFLWPEMLRCVEECRPAWVVNENVSGSLSTGSLDRKIDELEAAGYACWPPLLLSANAFGAAHIRERVFLVAHTQKGGFGTSYAATLTREERARSTWQHSFNALTERYAAGHTTIGGVLRAADGTAEGLHSYPRNGAIGALGNSIYFPTAVYILSIVHHAHYGVWPGIKF